MTAIVVAHLLVNIAHGLAHRELYVGIDPPASIFVIVVVLVSPLLAMAFVWTTKKRIGLILLSLSMFGSLLFGFISDWRPSDCGSANRIKRDRGDTGGGH